MMAAKAPFPKRWLCARMHHAHTHKCTRKHSVKLGNIYLAMEKQAAKCEVCVYQKLWLEMTCSSSSEKAAWIGLIVFIHKRASKESGLKTLWFRRTTAIFINAPQSTAKSADESCPINGNFSRSSFTLRICTLNYPLSYVPIRYNLDIFNNIHLHNWA